MNTLKENSIIFQNFPQNVINDLYKSCIQNHCTLLIEVVLKKEQLKLHRSLLGVKGGGQKQPSE